MNKKVYILKDDLKYDVPKDAASKTRYDFRMFINKRKLQTRLNERKKLIEKHTKPDYLVQVLGLMAFYYLFVGLLILISKLGK